MAADKMSAGFGRQSFQFVNYGALDAAHVSHNRARLQSWSHCVKEWAHLSNRRAQHNQVRPAHSFKQVERRAIYSPESAALAQARAPPNKTNNSAGQTSTLDGKSQRTAQQAHSNQGNLFP